MLCCQEFELILPDLTIVLIQCYGFGISGIVRRKSARAAPWTISLLRRYRAYGRKSGSRPRSTVGGRSSLAPHWSRNGSFRRHLVTMTPRHPSHALGPDPIVPRLSPAIRVGSLRLRVRHSFGLGLSGPTQLGPLFACY